jgi:hypothetical protein
VHVNGIEVSVTGSLDKALRTLRYEDRARVLWIDALCINQHDIAEKSGQVQEMGNIYSCADGVVIWLDCPSEHQDLVREVVHDSAVGSIYSTQDLLKVDSLKRSSDAMLPAISLRASQNLEHILDNPYWGRVWIIQEVSRARRDSTIVIGYGKDFELWRLEYTMRALYSGTRFPGSNLSIVIQIRKHIRAPPRLRDLDTEDATPEMFHRRIDLMYLLGCTRNFKSTDPRDRIFAICALSRDTRDHRFKPDYSMSIKQVAIAVTTAHYRPHTGKSKPSNAHLHSDQALTFAQCKRLTILPHSMHTTKVRFQLTSAQSDSIHRGLLESISPATYHQPTYTPIQQPWSREAPQSIHPPQHTDHNKMGTKKGSAKDIHGSLRKVRA